MVKRYWVGTIIEQSWLARLFLRLAFWIDGVPHRSVLR